MTLEEEKSEKAMFYHLKAKTEELTFQRDDKSVKLTNLKRDKELFKEQSINDLARIRDEIVRKKQETEDDLRAEEEHLNLYLNEKADEQEEMLSQLNGELKAAKEEFDKTKKENEEEKEKKLIEKNNNSENYINKNYLDYNYFMEDHDLEQAKFTVLT